MRETHKDGYKPGSYWVTCMRCGFDYRIEEMVIEQDTGKEVCKVCSDQPANTPSKRY